MLKLGNHKFELNTGHDRCALYMDAEDNGDKSFFLYCEYKEKELYNECVKPGICIRFINVRDAEVRDLVGKEFSIGSISQAEKRGDTFHIFSDEPMENYQLKIQEEKNGNVHVLCTGDAVVDSYVEKPQTLEFRIDEWLPVVAV